MKMLYHLISRNFDMCPPTSLLPHFFHILDSIKVCKSREEARGKEEEARDEGRRKQEEGEEGKRKGRVRQEGQEEEEGGGRILLEEARESRRETKG
jgi:hypothetical protein